MEKNKERKKERSRIEGRRKVTKVEDWNNLLMLITYLMSAF